MEDVTDTLCRRLDVEVHIEIPSIKDSQIGIDTLDGLIEEYAYRPVLTNAQGDDLRSQLKSLGMEVREGGLPLLIDNSHLLRIFPDRLLKEFYQTYLHTLLKNPYCRVSR